MKPKFFKTPAELRRWLTKNHAGKTELWIGFYKKASGRGGITYAQALDEALCFGWIDGVRKRVDDDSFMMRFSPRKEQSSWSAVNLRRFAELKKKGVVRAPGTKAFEARSKKKKPYSRESRPEKLAPSLEKKFRARKKAWAFFEDQPAGYRKTAIWWVMSAAKPETQLRRLTLLIGDSSRGIRLPEAEGKSRKKT